MLSNQIRSSRLTFVSAARAFSSVQDYDLCVVGGGPGGYVAAIKAAQLGLKTVCIEKRGTLGGTCLNVGCIPSKALLNATHKFHDAEHNFKKLGINVTGLTVDFDALMANKTKTVTTLTKGIEGLFRKNKVDYVKGLGTFVNDNELEVSLIDGGKQTVRAKNVLIATGSEPSELRGNAIVADEKVVVTSTGALALKEIPKKLVVIGAGVIGLELGSVYARLGSEVTVVEYADRITPSLDKEVSTKFKQMLEKQGMKFKLNMGVVGSTVTETGATLKLVPAAGGAEEELSADIVLLAVGRKPNTVGLGLEKIGVQTDKFGRIPVDTHTYTVEGKTSVKAIGDVIVGPMLAHKAEEEGVAAVEIIATGTGHVNYEAIPGVIYTHPEVANVGKSEEELKTAGIKYKKSVFPFMANSRAKANDDTEGFVKVLACEETDKLLGAWIVGPNAGELIQELVLAVEYGASTEDVARTCHAHPTLMEAVKEACMGTAFGKPIHF